MSCFNHESSEPICLRWRSSSWFVTFVIGLGVSVDLLVYSIIIPVIPFQLEKLGYTRVSALTGWLLFCYSGGLVISTIPIAWFTERYETRQHPLVLGLLILTGSQILFMFAPHYAVMCIARILQGIGSSMVWVPGLALLTDSAPETLIGTQLGIVMAGVSVGVTIGPPVGGSLYPRFGFRGPFIFGIICTLIDLVFRLLVVERKVAVRWGYDPAAFENVRKDQPPTASLGHEDATTKETIGDPERIELGRRASGSAQEPQVGPLTGSKPLGFLVVIPCLLKDSRTLVALLIAFVYGILFSSQEPALPLHLSKVWKLDSGRIGLVFLASVIPTIFSGILSGIWVDRSGTEWPTFISLIMAIPWWIIVVIEYRLALFITAFGFEAFFSSAVLAPVTTELAAVAREMDGIGYGHVYGAFNLVYGLGSALGPVIGGQIYAHVDRGWLALCLVATGFLAVSTILSFFFIGKDPLYYRLRRFMPPRRPS
ncbi:major facilitator superfamily domain-containing protein [Crepidotus variabilis]|uniref:Major facilitator superfamily domain-containing protein n=1 Tax=Crepidotus variabilis TaxID=179855 RepID=A0A9P6EVR4_9AGAR|nr:major facilitator superfamily domain-containing protein [Crepidotus variabilis]